MGFASKDNVIITKKLLLTIDKQACSLNQRTLHFISLSAADMVSTEFSLM